MKRIKLFLSVLTLSFFVVSCEEELIPVSSFTFSGANKSAPAEVEFTNISQNATTFLWEFGDGTNSTEKNTKHTYATAGTYAVKLTAYNGKNSNTMTLSITILAPITTITDVDGNVYHSVIIGTQTWMVENLKTTKYNDGTAIPFITDQSTWKNLSTGGYCNYGDVVANGEKYGHLYNWYAVNTGKLAPNGWHVPTDTEWSKLENFLGGVAIAGGKMKSTTMWASPNTGATNESGFTALPGGFRYTILNMNTIGYFGFWWSSTEAELTTGGCAWSRSLSCDNSICDRRYNYSASKREGYSIRCLKD